MRYSGMFFLFICTAQAAFAASGWDAVDQQSSAASPFSDIKPPAEPAIIEPQPSRALTSGFQVAQGIAGGGSTPAKAALSEATNIGVDAARKAASLYLPTFELGLSFSAGNKPVFGVLGVVPIYESKDLSNTVFSQLSAYRTDERTTVNLGLGDRHLLADDRVLLGVNAFYDHEFPYSHSRTSLGAEVRTSVAELNANFYQGESGWKIGRDGLAERAMGGNDVEIGIALPYMPQVKAYGRRFRWDAYDGAADVKGNVFSLKGSLVQGITLEFGRTYYGGAAQAPQPNSNFISFQVDIFKLLATSHQAKPFFASEAYALESMREHRYDKVRRENIIQKQIGNGFVVTASGR